MNYTSEHIELLLAGEPMPGADIHTGPGKVHVTLVLLDGDTFNNTYTTRHGRMIAGPAIVEIDLWDDGGVNIGYRETLP